MFVAGATLPAGSTLKFELEFTDSGSPEQAIASSLTEQATEQNRPSNIDRAISTEQYRPSNIDRATSTEQYRPRIIDRARIALDLGDERHDSRGTRRRLDSIKR